MNFENLNILIVSLLAYTLTETSFQPLIETCPLKMLIAVVETRAFKSNEPDLIPAKVTGNAVAEFTKSNFNHHEYSYMPMNTENALQHKLFGITF